MVEDGHGDHDRRGQDDGQHDFGRLDGQDVAEEIVEDGHIKAAGNRGQDNPQGQSDAAEDGDGRVAMQARRFFELHDAQRGNDGKSQGHQHRHPADEQPQGHPGEGDVGKSMADHGVLAQQEEDAQDGAGQGDEEPGGQGPLQEGVMEKGAHGSGA